MDIPPERKWTIYIEAEVNLTERGQNEFRIRPTYSVLVHRFPNDEIIGLSS